MAVPRLCDHPVNKTTFVTEQRWCYNRGSTLSYGLKDFAVPPLLSEGMTLTVYSLCTVCVCVFLNQYLSRGIEFSRASLNGALTQHKDEHIKTLKLEN